MFSYVKRHSMKGKHDQLSVREAQVADKSNPKKPCCNPRDDMGFHEQLSVDQLKPSNGQSLGPGFLRESLQ